MDGYESVFAKIYLLNVNQVMVFELKLSGWEYQHILNVQLLFSGAAIDLSCLRILDGKVCWVLYIDGLVISADGNLLDVLSIAIKVPFLFPGSIAICRYVYNFILASNSLKTSVMDVCQQVRLLLIGDRYHI